MDNTAILTCDLLVSHKVPVLKTKQTNKQKLSLLAVFTWVSNVIRVCFGFALLRLVIGLKLSRHFLSQSAVTPNQLWLPRERFPALRTDYMYLLRVLIDSLDYLCPLWLARVITLVLDLRHSIDNFSNELAHNQLAYIKERFRWNKRDMPWWLDKTGSHRVAKQKLLANRVSTMATTCNIADNNVAASVWVEIASLTHVACFAIDSEINVMGWFK